MLDHVVVDVEIAKTIEETPGGWGSTHLLGVACACVWQYSDQRMRIYGPDDVDALRIRLLKADRISGFNTFNFDFPVIWSVSKGDWKSASRPAVGVPGAPLFACAELRLLLQPKSDDLLRRIWIALRLDPDSFGGAHKGWSLDNVVKSTLMASKIGYGGDAPRWHQAGQWAKVANYCADDVCLERDLCDFIEHYGYVLNGDRRLEIPPWQPEAAVAAVMTHGEPNETESLNIVPTP